MLFGALDIAQASIPVVVGINNMLEQVDGSVGAPTAGVESAFQTLDTTPVTVPGLGEIPTNVARLCQYAFMRTPPPVRPNDQQLGVQTRGVPTPSGGQHSTTSLSVAAKNRRLRAAGLDRSVADHLR
jgi:hypothetical protein